MHLDHCCLNVRDMDASIAFWTERFGMELLSRRAIPENDAEIAFVGFPGADDGSAMKLELTHWGGWSEDDYVEGSLFDHVALVVDDLEGLMAELRANDVKVAREPYSLGGSSSRIAFVHDLDGNWVELIERP